jgi:hypothetical protein
MKNFYFVINKKDNYFELWVDGECITDFFSLKDDSADLMEQLVEFADASCYKKLTYKEVHEILLAN